MGTGGDVGEGQAGKPSAEPSGEPLATSPPTYLGQAAADLLDESKYLQAKYHAQTVTTTVKGIISNFKQNHIHRAK